MTSLDVRNWFRKAQKTSKVFFLWFLTSSAPEVVSPMVTRHVPVRPPTCQQQPRTKIFDLWRHVTSETGPPWGYFRASFGLSSAKTCLLFQIFYFTNVIYASNCIIYVSFREFYFFRQNFNFRAIHKFWKIRFLVNFGLCWTGSGTSEQYRTLLLTASGLSLKFW